jgi:hypothetical protein
MSTSECPEDATGIVQGDSSIYLAKAPVALRAFALVHAPCGEEKEVAVDDDRNMLGICVVARSKCYDGFGTVCGATAG